MENVITELTGFNIFGDKNVNIDFKHQVTFIAGSNGSGKSALLSRLHEREVMSINYPIYDSAKTYLIRHDDSAYKFKFAIESKYELGIIKSVFEKYFKLDKHLIQSYSSGQQQLIKLFLSVYFNKDERSLFLIDEPETSLHINWQKTLIDDLVAIAPNAQFIIATHSPAIIGDTWDNVINLDEDDYWSSGNVE